MRHALIFFLTFTTSGESSGPGGNTTEPRGAKEGNEKWEMPEIFLKKKQVVKTCLAGFKAISPNRC